MGKYAKIFSNVLGLYFVEVLLGVDLFVGPYVVLFIVPDWINCKFDFNYHEAGVCGQTCSCHFW